MNRIIALIFLLFLHFLVQGFAQENVVVDYESVNYLRQGKPLTSNYRLFASKNLSFYSMTANSKSIKGAFEANEEGTMVYTGGVHVKQIKRNDYYVNIEKETISQVGTLEYKTLQINDTPPSLNWHITDESKEIGEYIAIKAEVTFRGRDYEAWFTPEIPIPAGPWKFYGLPGLILEVTDKENLFQWYAQNIKYPAEFDSKFLEIDVADIDEEYSLKEFVENTLEEEAKQEKLEQSRAQRQGYKIESTVTEITRLERVYEWE